jgi:hypothetical protein
LFVAMQAQVPNPGWKLQIEAGGRSNPLGAKLRLGATYRREYGEASLPGRPRPYLQGGLATGISPASATASLHVEGMQLGFLVLRVQGDLYRYFGVYGALLEFPDKDAPFGDAARDALSGRELGRFGGRLLVQATLRAKLDRIVVHNQSELAWYAFGAGGPYFLEREYDTLLKDGDGLFVNRSTLLFRLWTGGAEAQLLLGPAYEFRRTFVGGLQRQRLSGVLQFCPWDRLGRISRPRLQLQAGINLQDANRDGQLFLAGAVVADVDL